jgi:DMSO/TMAO reductase YedYZ molybdopterin-dependent catalytic subunit
MIPSSATRARSPGFIATAILGLTIVVAASALAACAARSSTSGGGPQSESTATPLYPGEVRDYQGKDLSSIQDFYENSIKGPQNIDVKSYRLSIAGEVKTPLKLTYDEVLARKLYDKVVTLHCVEGWSVTIWWEGILLSDLLKAAGADMTSKIVVLRAYDGYSTSLPLDYIVQNDILLANKMNGVVIPPERGYPFMLVAQDRWGYKWCKWVTSIEVSNDESFRGYWEQRGYSNSGQLERQFFQ